MKYLIFSGEHRMFWRPFASGYTSQVALAGRYEKDEADAVTAHCGPDKMIEILPEPQTPNDIEQLAQKL